jgi:hypothetical protein
MSDNKGVDDAQPLLFRDINQGLLRFALQHQQQSTDAITSAPTSQRDPKDYEWLRGALSQMESDAKKMRKLLDTLENREILDDTQQWSRLRMALEELEYFVQDVDNAADLIVLGGVTPLLALLSHADAQVRFWTAFVIQTACQNNPKPTLTFVEKGALSTLMLALPKESDEMVASKFLACISGKIMENDMFFVSFFFTSSSSSSSSLFVLRSPSSFSFFVLLQSSYPQ